MAIAILFGVFALLLLIGLPVAFALFSASLATALYLGLPPILVILQLNSGASAVTLIAIPLFIFAGEIMLRGGISERIIGLAAALVGRLRGGLAQVNVASSLLFGGVSGSALADVSAVGGAMVPQMIERGFHRDFAVNVTISAALAALLVPPSHNLILYSASAGGGISIADLFTAGILPALLLTLSLMTTVYVIARARGYRTEVFPGWPALLNRFVAALPGLLLVGVIFTGIRAGIFTAVESGAVAVLYALLVTALVYRQLPWRQFADLCMHAARNTGAILFVIAAAAAFGWLLAWLHVPAATVAALGGIVDNHVAVLLLMALILLVLGTFMDLAPMIIICTPIFLPVAKAAGVDPLQFGVILVLTGGIGLITPPVGSVMFVGCAIGRISVGELMRTIWPFYLAMLSVLLLVIFIPGLSLWLPQALK